LGILTLFICMSSLISTGSKASPVNEHSIKSYRISDLEWRLWGYTPEGWRNNFDFNNLSGSFAEYRNIPVKVPGSVQLALKNAGVIQDWNIGLNSLNSEWVTNRSWIYTASIPDQWIEQNQIMRLKLKGLDGNGVILINGKEIGTFNNAFITYNIDVSTVLKKADNKIAIVFGIPPAYLGQVYWTSKIKNWKPRFNYGWDWMPRIVQIGIWDDVLLEVSDPDRMEIADLDISTSASQSRELGSLAISIKTSGNAQDNSRIEILLSETQGKVIFKESVPFSSFKTKEWKSLKIKRWWPNGAGNQPLYKLSCRVLDNQGKEIQVLTKTIGFKHIAWLAAKNAPAKADPWICSVNNMPLFLQGINWTPIRPNFADLTEPEYRKLLTIYKGLGINTLRVWGGGFPEKEWFYDLCDALGFLIQQDFPLSSSGLDNYPPVSLTEIDNAATIARHYIKRNKHHVAMLMWCGGNELYEMGDQRAVDTSHPMIKKLAEIVQTDDPGRRFVSGSPSGRNISVTMSNIGSGENWDTHGPWGLPFTTAERSMDEVRQFWLKADALMFSEVGVPGAMSAEMINKYKGALEAFPATYNNPLWNRVNWWNEWDDYQKFKKGDKNTSLGDYVDWSQRRQTEGLTIALATTKAKFPAVGGMLLWMGHDSFPCLTNNSIIDFDGNLKPAARALEKIWKTNPEQLQAKSLK